MATFLAADYTANAQFILPGTNAARSVSGQFIVHRIPPARAVASNLENDSRYLKFEPALAAVSCERIKRALADMLDDRSSWHGKIYVTFYPAESADDGGTVVAEKFRDGWNYRLELPNPMERTRFVRAIVQSLLLERASRNARDHAPEIPEWLAAGLTEHLRQSDSSELLPPPARWGVNGLTITPVAIGTGEKGALRNDPLAFARQKLRERPPLTLAELSWPTAEQLDGPDSPAYRSSAQLFVSELLRLANGRASLTAMLDELANCYNWQTAFFHAFHSQFERQVDLEKWWALQVVHFTGRDPAQTWSMEESWRKLDELLRAPVEIRHARDELPERAEISLATVIRDWSFVRQSQMLRAKLRELELLRLRVAHDLVGLVDDYRKLLTIYLDRRNRAGLILRPSANNVARETLKQLAALEARRQELRPKPAPVASANVDEPTAAQP